jgi:hypothetical protein
MYYIVLNGLPQERKGIYMPEITVDDEVFKFLKKHAEPFDDTPNSVLRRFLLGEKPLREDNQHERKDLKTAKASQYPLEDFIDWVLKNIFSERFIKCPPYRTMYESESQIIYFQNLNKGESNNLWFRLRSKQLQVMRSSCKKAYICLTIPADEYGYLIPLNEVDSHVSSANWPRSYLEVNIDPSDNRWRELEWKLDEYEVIMTDVDKPPQKDELEKDPLNLLLQECDDIYDSNNGKEAFFESEDNLNHFLQRIVTFAHTIDVGPHTAVVAVALWIKKKHPDKYEKYSPWLNHLRKSRSFEILTLISTIK